MMPYWLDSPEWTALVKALLHSLWQGTLAAALLAVALRRMANPAARYRSALGALVAVVTVTLLTWAILCSPPPPTKTLPPTAPPTTSNSALPNSALPTLIVNAPPPEQKFAPVRWTAWLALVWVAGATMMLARAAAQVAGAERLRRSSRPLDNSRLAALLAEARQAVGLARRVRLAVTDKLTSPVVAGVLVPTLILPLSLTTTLAPEQIRFILLHELAHIRRGDYFANLFQLFAEALLFFNPAVWWISRQARLEREACCDALAVELSGAPADYARTLVHVMENVLSPASAATPALGDRREPSSLADRVQRMLVPGYRPALRLTWRAMFVALLAGCSLLFLTAFGTRGTIAAILTPSVGADGQITGTSASGIKPAGNNAHTTSENISLTALNGVLHDPNFRPALKALEQRRNTEALGEPQITVISGRQTILRAENVSENQLPRSYGPPPVLLAYGGSPDSLYDTFASPTAPLTDPNFQAHVREMELRTGGAFSPVPSSYISYSTSSNQYGQASGGRAIPVRQTGIRPPIYTGPGRQAIVAKLDKIHLDNVTYDALPLNEVLKQLTEQCRLRDPERKGINFLINNNPDLSSAVPVLDPNTGLPVTAPPPTEQQDVGSFLIKIPSLVDVRLADVLDAIVLVSDHPIKYSIQDFAIVFSPKDPAQLFMRTFRVDPNTFSSGLENVSAQSFGAAQNNGNSTGGGQGQNNGAVVGGVNAFPGAGNLGNSGAGNSSRSPQGGPGTMSNPNPKGTPTSPPGNVTPGSITPSARARAYFKTLGVNLDSPSGKSVFFNDRLGTLFVKATESDLDTIERALQVLNQAQPQVHVKTRFYETSETNFDQYWTITNSPEKKVGILTDANTQIALRDLQSHATSIGEPEITTPSGRQAQMRATVEATYVTGLQFTQGRSADSYVDVPRGMSTDNVPESRPNPATKPTPKPATPQVHIKTRFYEMTKDEFTHAGLSLPDGKRVGILTDPNFRVALRGLESRADSLGEPEVTVISGRQVQMRTTTASVAIVTNYFFNEKMVQWDVQESTTTGNGPILDIVPYVLSDGYTINLALIPTDPRFPGFNKPQSTLPQAAGNVSVVQLPTVIPKFTVRQLVTTANVWDNQTVVLITRINDKPGAPEKELLTFVTATIVDPAGSRVHTDEEMPYAQNSFPPQPEASAQTTEKLQSTGVTPTAGDVPSAMGNVPPQPAPPAPRATEGDASQTVGVSTPATNAPAPQIHIKARFYAVPKDTSGDFGKYLTLTNPSDGKPMGILTSQNARAAIQELQSRTGSETLAEPEITMLSRHQAQLRVTELVNVVTNLLLVKGPHGETWLSPQTNMVEVGPVLDAVPDVLADGYTIHLTAMPSLKEFLGYEQLPPPQSSSGADQQIPTMLPTFRNQQTSAEANLWDGQTLVLSGFKERIVSKNSKTPIVGDLPVLGRLFAQKSFADKEVLIFITVTLIDPAGNRLHSDDELPFTQDAVPPQPAPAK